MSQSDLMDLWCMATSTTAAYRVMAAVKIKSIECWAPAAAGASQTVDLEWVGSGTFASSRQNISDTTLGTSRPAHIYCKPPKDSIAEMWITDGSTAGNLFNIAGPADTIVEVKLQFVIRNSEASTAVGAAVAAATVGRLYCRRLDSNNASIMIPISMDTI